MMNWEEERVSSKEVEVVWRGGWMLAFGAMVKSRNTVMVTMSALDIDAFRLLGSKIWRAPLRCNGVPYPPKSAPF